MGTLNPVVVTPEPNTVPGSALVPEKAIRTQTVEKTKGKKKKKKRVGGSDLGPYSFFCFLASHLNTLTFI